MRFMPDSDMPARLKEPEKNLAKGEASGERT